MLHIWTMEVTCLDDFVSHQCDNHASVYIQWVISWMACHCMMWHVMAWVSYQRRKIAGAHAPGIPGTFSPPQQVSDPDMHHGTCVTHVPWCMPGSLTSGFLWNRRRGKNVPGIPGACATYSFTYLVRDPCCCTYLHNISTRNMQHVWDIHVTYLDDGSCISGRFCFAQVL